MSSIHDLRNRQRLPSGRHKQDPIQFPGAPESESIPQQMKQFESTEREVEDFAYRHSLVYQTIRAAISLLDDGESADVVADVLRLTRDSMSVGMNGSYASIGGSTPHSSNVAHIHAKETESEVKGGLLQHLECQRQELFGAMAMISVATKSLIDLKWDEDTNLIRVLEDAYKRLDDVASELETQPLQKASCDKGGPHA